MSKIIITFFILIFIILGTDVFAQSNDAIAVRIMPNPKHYSALRWYLENIEKEQQGSPAQVLVDGYEAVRDGRTVYVAAGNVGGGTLYTNIYILSYTQNPSGETVDIFGQLLNNWTFNVNLVTSNSAGHCRTLNKNEEKTTLCYTDFECGANGVNGQYCDSAKAKVTRDVRRLSDLRTITDAAQAYKTSHDNTPVQLLAGTYIRGQSISAWPSWQETLGQMLGIPMPMDPLNSLWVCREDPQRDPAKDGTCWNEVDKTFNGGNTVIPTGLKNIGRVYSYVFTDGATPNYQVCADNEAKGSTYTSIYSGDNAENNPTCF